ncbi:PEP-utilizing enzyme [Actinophytocola sp.]|uniref:PEP-utilizing enzyme n=1 Tax=Actinophytocola sp. TaxID=1872138 RepID=UPI002ED543B3
MTPEGWLTDTLPSSRFPVYTRLNANDVLPDPVTPLGASLAWIPWILPGWADGYVALDAFAASELAGEEVAPVAGLLYGHLYINQSTVRIIGIRAGIGWEAIDSAFFSYPGAPPHEEEPSDINEALSEKMAARTMWALTTTTFPELEEERDVAERCRAERPDLGSLTPAALIARARSVMPLERLMWRGETIASNQTAIGPGVINQLVGALDPSLAIRLIGAAGDVDSAAPSFALWDLSRLIRTDEALSAEFASGLDGLLDRLHEGQPEFDKLFARFIREFGYRGPSEWDLGSESWETRPELVLALLDRLRHLEDELSPLRRKEERAAEAEEATRQALELLGDNQEAKQTLELAIASARRFASWRERAKTNAIKVLHEARVALLELGRRLHTDGHLAHPRQIFMAVDNELEVLVAEPAALRDVLAERERQWRELSTVELPMYVDGRKPLPPLDELPRRAEAEATHVRAGDDLTGAGASAGVARGRVRVVTDPGDIADFQPGEILVAPQTDPSWTPLFMVAAGVIVDVGAMGSHAMIVSRELGIPCVAGVAHATRRIPNGALVEVDGSTGRVSVLDI